MEEEKIQQSTADTEPHHLFDDVPLERQSTSPVPVLPELGVALGVLLFVFSVTYVGIGTTGSLAKNSKPSDYKIESKLVDSQFPSLSPAQVFMGIELDAQSAIVWDVQKQKILFNKNADDRRPLASVTKLMTALVAYELLDPEDRVAIPLSALKAEGDSGFVDGEEFTVQNLTDLTLISSSNDGATALSASAGNAILKTSNPERVFVTAMNVKAEELGLSKTYFENSTGLDISPSQAGAYGSARDMALLMEYIITHVADAVALTTVDITNIDNEKGQYHTAKNTNEVVNDIDGLIASKTGYTELAGGNLVIAFDAGLNRPIVVAVLGSSYDGRFVDTLELIEKTREYVAQSDQ